MIYRQLVSKTSIQCGHFQLPLSTRNWEAMTFGMAPWHLVSETDRHKEALQSQLPIAAFKACNCHSSDRHCLQQDCLPNGDSKGECKNRTYCPLHGTIHTNGNMQLTMQINCVKFVQVHFYARNVLYWSESSSATRMQIIQIAHLQIQPAPSCVV